MHGYGLFIQNGEFRCFYGRIVTFENNPDEGIEVNIRIPAYIRLLL